MQARLLIINCPGANFLHIPMGTFGLCDFLNQRKIPAKILNLALYDETDRPSLIDYHIEQFRPTHVGLILHWQETAEQGIRVAQHIKSRTDPAKIICGGFTAGYFGEALLRRYPSVDYVIKGDPERPMELLLKDAPEQEIPNLIYRDGADIRVNEVSYFIDEETLSGISFSKLTCLFDHDVYIRAVEEKLWFPIFIGRGCIFGCDYCGGSRESFRLHSARVKPVSRSIAAIITDLKRLKEFTRKIYICYEIDQGYIKTLFKAIKAEETLIKTFRLNYGAWQLFDRQFLELYRELFIIDNQDKPLFEISPEVFDDRSREGIKHHKTYSIEELKENLGLINDCLGTGMKVNIFFSRYHDTAQTYAAIMDEIFSIFRLKHDLFAKKYMGVNVCYDHLSTDVGSRYWESYIEKPHDPNTLISWKRRLRDREQYSFPLDNLCVFIPKALSEKEIFRCELLIFMLKDLEKQSNEFFHVLFACLDELVIRALEETITDQYSNRAENVFKSLDHCKLLLDLKKTILQNESMLSKIPFIEDLTSLQIKKAQHQSGSMQSEMCDGTKRPKLNHALISVHDHDYLDLPGFLERLQKEGPKNLRHEKTVSVFLVDEIMSMPYETYRMTIKAFERGLSLDQYYMLMRRKGILDASYHKKFLAKMFQSGVLY
ncbi:MAG: hypothetical protein J7K15_06310 [Deltaproteobacteria bacterium]|nr:hypothetical protein [Deltaproteobacteria bacterium]